jgi:NitT/TauT family transport system permease protein
MFESTSSVPRRLVTAIIVFFPVFLNTLRGLREVDPVHRELMTSYAASGWTFARKVRLPGALPFVFTGLRQASSLAVIAAVVAEYFGGLQTGLGSRITSAAAFTAYPRAWAFVVGACLLGLLFYLTTLVIERLAMPWKSRLLT